jgi:dethiobiotin synthetase
MMRGLFVTGTGTDVGKTWVTCALLAQGRAQGIPVRALKPVLSGIDDDEPAGSDAAHLLAALGRPVTPDTLEEVAPFRFRAPLSPDMAAAREGRHLSFEAVVRACDDALGRAEGPLLIEGIGGLMVPLETPRTVLDLALALGLPALVVAGSSLGTLSHTLTTLAVMEAKGLACAGVVVSESETSPVPLAETVAALGRFVPDTPVVGAPRHKAPDLAWLLDGARAPAPPVVG